MITLAVRMIKKTTNRQLRTEESDNKLKNDSPLKCDTSLSADNCRQYLQ